MKSVGEAMAIGRTFTQALQKALRSLEKRGSSFHWNETSETLPELFAAIRIPTDKRIVQVQQALRLGASLEQVFDATKIDPWFLDQIALINQIASWFAGIEDLAKRDIVRAKKHGFSDAQLASLRGIKEEDFRSLRHSLDVRPVFKTVDTCAGEFPALTPYHYSSYDQQTEVVPSNREKVVILGSGPNRIGQGVEFDYSCVHAAFALRDAGYETIMINCNPETVSTDYDTSDRLYFEPLTLEDVLEVIHAESQSGKLLGVLVQLGGQTALGLAQGLKDEGVPILGTSPESIDLAEERGLFQEILDKSGLRSPANGTATNFAEAKEIAERIGHPVLVRPSFVLGGRGMEIVYDERSLADYFERIAEHALVDSKHPLLVDRFLDDAIEIDVDAIFDGETLYVGGVMEHIEEAGIHSGDSSCTLPPITLSDAQVRRVVEATEQIAKGLDVTGLLNVQFALASDVLYVLEANPRASRTVPFVSKALGITLAKAAALVMVGRSIKSIIENGLLPKQDATVLPANTPVSVKEAVLPFKRFATREGRFVDSLLGPEMRSTGEVMGIDTNFPSSFAKSQAAAGSSIPLSGTVFISVADRDKPQIVLPVRRLAQLGYRILATEGTSKMLRRHGIASETVAKYSQASGQRSIVEMITDGEVDVVVNTPSGADARSDGYEIRAATTAADKPIFTTVAQLAAAIGSFEIIREGGFSVTPLQVHARFRETADA
jgi:carbamoyl-phosphate synthase large subunit